MKNSQFLLYSRNELNNNISNLGITYLRIIFGNSKSSQFEVIPSSNGVLTIVERDKKNNELVCHLLESNKKLTKQICYARPYLHRFVTNGVQLESPQQAA